MKRILLLSSALVVSVALVPAQASAQCVEVAGTATCAGTDTNGFTSSTANLAVDVLTGASVTNSGDALRLNGASTTVTNAGSVDGGDEGIDIRGANGTITNAATGLIRGADRGIDADAIDGLTVKNFGQITGVASDALRLGNGGTVTNALGATINGADEGIQALANLTFTNQGTLIAADEGVEATDNGTITNTGTISSADDAIQADDNTTITNSGLIESSANDGIDIDTGSVINSGIIRATGGGEDGIDFDPNAVDVVSTVDNKAGALIEGAIGINVDLANDRGQAITNAGTITGTGGTALFLEDGKDSLTLLGTGILNGTADFGGDDDSLILAGVQAALVGGGGLFDGGLAIDTVQIDITLASVISLLDYPVLADAVTLTFRNLDDSISSVNLVNFELFALRDGIFDKDQILAAVPLPASLLLLGGAIGLLGLGRRRRSA